MKGVLITPEGDLVKGEVTVEEGVAVFEERECKPEYVFAPTLFNAHTHIGDTVAKEPGFGRLEEVVGPDSYKFKALRECPDSLKEECILNSIKTAVSSGTTALLDFREEGVKGVEILERVNDGTCLPLSRPSNVEEALKLVEISIGFGMSSVRDHDFEFLEELRRIAKRHGKIFAIHAGERDDEDVDLAIELEPDLIVHMNMARPNQIRRAMDMGIPIVSCPRSNAFFDLLNVKNYRALSEYDLWLLGTDNAMICNPSMIEEMHFASFIVRDDVSVLKASLRGFDLFDVQMGLIVFRTDLSFKCSRNPVSTFVRRVGGQDILKVYRKAKLSF